MSLPTSLQSYQDCLDFFERVVDDPKGGRVWIGTYSDAYNFRMRCNKARQLHREENKKIHDPGMKMYGASEYDPLQLKLKEDTTSEWWVYAERVQLDPSTVELLSELE
jgi:pyruvate formate-lyase activating enzyme-like uncharacterized protein